MSRPAVFLDRDGVLVEEVYYPDTGEWDAPRQAADICLISGSAAAAKRLADAGSALVLISNQAAFAKGKTTLRALWLAHERFVDLLATEGVSLDAVFYAYGHPQGTEPYFSGPSLDRKPGPYNLHIAAARLDLDLARSWFVGDRETDMACAQAAGVRGILVRNSHAPAVAPAYASQAEDLADAACHIIGT